MSTPSLLKVNHLSKRYPLKSTWFQKSARWLEAVKNVSFEIRAGESLGLVGESGCGKSTLARLMGRFLEPTSGSILYQNQNIHQLNGAALLTFRRAIQMVFQDPMSSLNPKMRIGDTLAEPLQIHRIVPRHQLKEQVAHLLLEVGLDPTLAQRFPATLSGGQRQRIGVARALSLNPQLLICDEPVSSLDLSVQAQILQLLNDLQQKRHLTLLFISHNLAIVSVMTDRILVMKSGEIVEEAPNPQLFQAPQHPYTQQLVKLAARTL